MVGVVNHQLSISFRQDFKNRVQFSPGQKYFISFSAIVVLEKHLICAGGLTGLPFNFKIESPTMSYMWYCNSTIRWAVVCKWTLPLPQFLSSSTSSSCLNGRLDTSSFPPQHGILNGKGSRPCKYLLNSQLVIALDMFEVSDLAYSVSLLLLAFRCKNLDRCKRWLCYAYFYLLYEYAVLWVISSDILLLCRFLFFLASLLCLFHGYMRRYLSTRNHLLLQKCKMFITKLRLLNMIMFLNLFKSIHNVQGTSKWFFFNLMYRSALLFCMMVEAFMYFLIFVFYS